MANAPKGHGEDASSALTQALSSSSFTHALNGILEGGPLKGIHLPADQKEGGMSLKGCGPLGNLSPKGIMSGSKPKTIEVDGWHK